MRKNSSIFAYSTLLLQIGSIALPLFLQGCRDPQKDLPEETPVLHASANMAGKSIILTSFTDRLLLRSSERRPVVTDKYIVDYRYADMTIYSPVSMETLHVFSKMNCDQMPTFIDEHRMIVATKTQIILVDLESKDSSILTNLDAPLLAAPLVFSENHIFVQYMNNMGQCFDLYGHSLWKVMLPYSASYYKQTAYAPSADETSLYLAYPGGAMIKLNQKTGGVEWLSAAFSDRKEGPNSSFAIAQLVSPILLSNSLVMGHTSDNLLVCIDKETGMIVHKIEVAEKSKVALSNDQVFFIDTMQNLSCYDTNYFTQQWSTPITNFSKIIGPLDSDMSVLLIQQASGKILALNSQTGEALQKLSYEFRDYDLFSSAQHLYAFNPQGTLIQLDIPSTLKS